MKKFLSIILALMVILSVTACNTNIPSDSDEKLSVVATIFPQYDFAREIAGDKASISMLVSPGTETHSFEPTASDIMEISTCDIFIYTGGESDSWIDSLLSNVNNPNMTIISLMDCVNTIETEEQDESDDHDDHNHGKADEHVWTSPLNAKIIAEKICEEMCRKDEDNASFYMENLNTYTSKLDMLDSEFRAVVTNAQRDTLVFGDRFPLAYFANEYNLRHHAAFSGCSDDTEVSASTLATLIDTVKAEKLPVVLKIELSSDSIANTIATQTGAEVLTFYSCHNISKEDFDAGESYVSLMTKNVDTLKKALN